MLFRPLVSIIAVLALLACAGLARADDKAIKNFTASFDNYSDTARQFPDKFEMFDFNDQKSTLAFGKDQPWRLINFWANWCPPCIAELPSLKALQDKTRQMKGFKVILVSTDMPANGAALKYVIKQKNMPDMEAVYVKDFYMWQSFDIAGLPTTILVSPEGKIAYTFVGDAKWDSPEAAAYFKAVLPAASWQ